MNNNHVMSAVIKVDVDNNYPNRQYYARNYEVPYNVNVEEYMEFIKELGQAYSIPITRVYLSGHTLVSPNSLMTKEKIENFFKNTVINTNETVASMKR